MLPLAYALLRHMILAPLAMPIRREIVTDDYAAIDATPTAYMPHCRLSP